MNTESDRHAIELATTALNEQVAELSEDVQARLSAARRAAVSELDRQAPVVLSPWIPTVAVATTLLAVGLLSFHFATPELPLYNGEEAQLAAQNMELLTDMEFVAWLVEEDESNAG